VRRRSALVEALELFRDIHPNITMGQMLSFLYICENEGLTILDLAEVSCLYLATASRCARALAEPGSPGALDPALGLVELSVGAAGKVLRLTEQGRRVRQAFDAIIAEASPLLAAG
jgi:DNA-binding MarR family transcriptional regulator